MPSFPRVDAIAVNNWNVDIVNCCSGVGTSPRNFDFELVYNFFVVFVTQETGARAFAGLSEGVGFAV